MNTDIPCTWIALHGSLNCLVAEYLPVTLFSLFFFLFNMKAKAAKDFFFLNSTSENGFILNLQKVSFKVMLYKGI